MQNFKSINQKYLFTAQHRKNL